VLRLSSWCTLLFLRRAMSAQSAPRRTLSGYSRVVTTKPNDDRPSSSGVQELRPIRRCRRYLRL